ncbi:MAG: hypothetical protein HY897_13985 [Deltaproteobacteria bacterium]|nr:hypothetical protein [Deltaproteobacteria bacterium]
MGEIRVRVLLENMGDVFVKASDGKKKTAVRALELDALVDTGAVLLFLPQEVVEKLGLIIIDKAIVSLANEQKIELDRAGPLAVTIAGRKMVTECLVGPPGCEPLVGQIVLESLDLITDSLKRTITVRPESPYLPTLKLK